MSRSKWKLKHTVFSPLQLKRKVWDRDLTLEEGLIGSTYYVYNGTKFLKLKIDELKIGLQEWYNGNHGVAIQEEICAILSII